MNRQSVFPTRITITVEYMADNFLSQMQNVINNRLIYKESLQNRDC